MSWELRNSLLRNKKKTNFINQYKMISNNETFLTSLIGKKEKEIQLQLTIILQKYRLHILLDFLNESKD